MPPDFTELLKNFLAAPVYYALPLGVGLLVCRPFQAVLTRTQHVLLAYFCGLVLICVVMVAREHAVPSRQPIQWFAGAIVLAALAGFALGRRLFAPDANAARAALEYLAVVPVFALGYALRFTVYSDFPVTDLFQATHLMKGALEFGRFDVLNPFAAGSYIPVIPVIEGLMVRYLGFDPLLGAWILPALATVLKFLACRAAFQSVLSERSARFFATAAAACFFSAITPTNGELALLGSLLVFSLAARCAADGRIVSAGGAVAAGLLGLGLGYAAARSAPWTFVAVLAAAAALPAAAARLRLPRALLAIPVLLIALSPLHRSTLAFAPTALLAGVALPWLSNWLREGGLARLRSMGATVALATGLAGAGAIGLLAWVLLNPGEDMRDVGPGKWLVETLLNATFAKANIQAGAGPKVALFELARAIMPSLALSAALLVALALLRQTRNPAAGTAALASAQALAAWTLAVLFGSVLLLGVPFVYRSGFFLIVLLVTALAGAWRALGQPGASGSMRAVAAFAALCVLAIPLFYRCGAASPCERAEYLDMAGTLLTVVGGLVLAGAALVGARRRAAGWLLPAALVGLFALESSVSRAYFMPYSYGAKSGSEIRPVSHLSREEVKLAAALWHRGGRIVIVSDPYTMANLRALTGLNSLVTYSNLATLSEATDARLREWLREVLAPAKMLRTCSTRHPLEFLDETVNSSEFNYWLARLSGPQDRGGDVLREFGLSDTLLMTVHPGRKGQPDRFPDHRWRGPAIRKLEARFPEGIAILLVVSRKTLHWMRDGEEAGYFPDVGPLDVDLLEQLKRRCGAEVYDARFALIQLAKESPGRGH
jgi:hypothetical protein